MAPIKSSLAKTAKQLLGFRNTADLGLRGATQISRTPPPEKVTASGGDIVDALAPGNGYKYHTFSSPGNFTVTAGFGSLAIVEILVVAGGGSGSSTNIAGGAGGGGVVHATGYAVTPGTYPVSVGGGGQAPAFSGPNPSRTGVPGNDSYFGPSGARLTAKGGGGGGNSYTTTPGGQAGGSGAGGGANSPPYPFGSSDNAQPGPATQPGQTHPGAPGTINNYGSAGGTGGGGPSGPNLAGAGGGGAGGAGTSMTWPQPSNGNPSVGGPGQPFPDFAYPLCFPGPDASTLGPHSPNNSHYAGGGGGGRHIAGGASAQPGPTNGGVGGGGKGGNGRSDWGGYGPEDGIDYLGGGGGDANGYEQGGHGGDGIVIVRYVA